jgi:hypothetical protein
MWLGDEFVAVAYDVSIPDRDGPFQGLTRDFLLSKGLTLLLTEEGHDKANAHKDACYSTEAHRPKLWEKQASDEEADS